MKRLFVMRHSKAGQTNKKITEDHARELTDKGKELCPLMGKLLVEKDWIPELVLSSTATRAYETAELLFDQTDKIVPVEFNPRLYLASVGEIITEIQQANNDVKTLLYIGHNPGLQQFCMTIAGKGDKTAFRKMRASYPPAALTVFDLDIDRWSQLAPQTGELVDFILPKDLKN